MQGLLGVKSHLVFTDLREMCVRKPARSGGGQRASKLERGTGTDHEASYMMSFENRMFCI